MKPVATERASPKVHNTQKQKPHVQPRFVSCLASFCQTQAKVLLWRVEQIERSQPLEYRSIAEERFKPLERTLLRQCGRKTIMTTRVVNSSDPTPYKCKYRGLRTYTVTTDTTCVITLFPHANIASPLVLLPLPYKPLNFVWQATYYNRGLPTCNQFRSHDDGAVKKN